MTLLELLQDRGVPFRRYGEHHHVTEGWLGLDCPYCSKGSGHFRLGFHPDYGVLNCWTCGRLRPAETLSELLGLPISQIIPLLRRPGPPIPKGGKLRGTLAFPKGTGPLLPAHKKYLRSRRLDPAVIERLWSVKGIGISPKWPWRVLLPVIYRGVEVSWTARSLSDETRPKYANAEAHEEFEDRHALLYGGDYVRHAVIVCEGPFDAIAIGPGAVALMGLNCSPEQFAAIAKHPLRVVCFDSEPDAQRRARRLCADLSPLPGKTARVELDAKDAGSAAEKELTQLRMAFLGG